MHSIFQHAARTDTEARARARAIAMAGGTVRTAAKVLDELVIFDREIALISRPGHGRNACETAIVFDPALVGLLCRIHEHIWQSAVAFDPGAPAPCRETFDDAGVTILRLLASGLKDETIARRIGVSSRTLRRHLSAIMDQLHAGSRFQAGVEAMRAGLVDAGSVTSIHS